MLLSCCPGDSRNLPHLPLMLRVFCTVSTRLMSSTNGRNTASTASIRNIEPQHTASTGSTRSIEPRSTRRIPGKQYPQYRPRNTILPVRTRSTSSIPPRKCLVLCFTPHYWRHRCNTAVVSTLSGNVRTLWILILL